MSSRRVTPAEFSANSPVCEPASWEFLVIRYDAMVRRYVRRFARNSEDEADFAQDTWALAWQCRAQFAGTGDFGGWLIRLSRTVCVRQFRREQRLRPLCESTLVDQANAALDTSVQDRDGLTASSRESELFWDTFYDVVMSLPERRRIVVICRLVAGYSVADTARLLQISQGTVKATLNHAVGQIRRKLPTGWSELAD